MSESKFKVGDVVVLKSGGPAMTVYGVMEDGCVGCIWFSAKDDTKPYDRRFDGKLLLSEEEAEATLEDGDDEDDEVTQ
jgi:uncharacterized protein YodC (DUF2158 family)